MVEDIQAKMGGGSNIKKDPEEIGWSDGDWIFLAQISLSSSGV